MMVQAAGAAVPPSLPLRIGHEVLDPGTPWTRIAEAVETSNAAQRLPGLPDTLNPGVLDPAKVAALLDLLHRDPAIAAGITGPLALDGGGLGVGAAEPVTAEAIGRATRLTPGPTASRAVLDIEPDCALAEKSAGTAREAFEAAEREVAGIGMPTDADGLRALSAAKSRRSAIAQSWRLNAGVVAICKPGDRPALADFAAARHAVATTLVAPRTGMPK